MSRLSFFLSLYLCFTISMVSLVGTLVRNLWEGGRSGCLLEALFLEGQDFVRLACVTHRGMGHFVM